MPCTARVEMQFGCNTLSNGFGAFFHDWDVTLTPISTSTTHRTCTLDYIMLKDTNAVLDRHYKLWGTPLGNLSGNSLPMAAHENGLPLSLSAQVERALDGKGDSGRMPSVHVTHA
jgi:amidase